MRVSGVGERGPTTLGRGSKRTPLKRKTFSKMLLGVSEEVRENPMNPPPSSLNSRASEKDMSETAGATTESGSEEDLELDLEEEEERFPGTEPRGNLSRTDSEPVVSPQTRVETVLACTGVQDGGSE